MNIIVLPSGDVRFGINPDPKLTALPVEVNPVPVMVMFVPTGPEVGEREITEG